MIFFSVYVYITYCAAPTLGASKPEIAMLDILKNFYKAPQSAKNECEFCPAFLTWKNPIDCSLPTSQGEPKQHITKFNPNF